MALQKKLLVALAVGSGLLLLYGPGWIRWAELKARQDRLESEIVALKEENRRLYEEARRLREDPAYAEEVARKELGFVRPGETMVEFKE